MKDSFRQSMKWLHTWVGLVVGWILFFMFITGTTGYMAKEITRWMEPERPLSTPHFSTSQLLDSAQVFLSKHAVNSQVWDIYLPGIRDPNLQVGWLAAPEPGESKGNWVTKVIDPQTGQAINVRDSAGGNILYRMHYRLHYIDGDIGYWIVGFCTMLMLLAVLTGVVFHKKIFSDFFTFRPKKGLIGWLDIHNVLSVVALPFHFVITYSGLLFFLTTYMVLSSNIQMTEQQENEMHNQLFPRLEAKPAGQLHMMAPLSQMYLQAQKIWAEDSQLSNRLSHIEILAPNDLNARAVFLRNKTDISYNPADEVIFNAANGQLLKLPARDYPLSATISNGFISLHEGVFATPALRWLYVITGLIGAAMVASGLILWTTKRKPQQMKKATGPDLGYRVVEQLNIGTIVGLPVAIAAYFYANRLLPLELTNRAAWEVNILFITWAVLLIYPAFRPAVKAWFEQLTLAGGVFVLLPFVNWLTTDKHLLVTITHGDWSLASFDLTMLIIGLVFLFASIIMWRKQQSQRDHKRRDMQLPFVTDSACEGQSS